LLQSVASGSAIDTIIDHAEDLILGARRQCGKASTSSDTHN
jgi:hypothetical protein